MLSRLFPAKRVSDPGVRSEFRVVNETKDDTIRSLSDALNESERDNKTLRQESDHWRKLLAMLVDQNGGTMVITNSTIGEFPDDYQIVSTIDTSARKIAINVNKT